jgi:hypothetical protein
MAEAYTAHLRDNIESLIDELANPVGLDDARRAQLEREHAAYVHLLAQAEGRYAIN